jgi:5-methyltetrahydropteroyltriglutamate--homocysteine methyltransferase
MLHFRGGRDAISRDAYPTRTPSTPMLPLRGRSRRWARCCRYLQLDDTNLAYLCDAKMRDGVASAAMIPTSCRAATRA